MDVMDVLIARKLGGTGGSGGSGGTGGGAAWNDVTFIDYDGTVLYSYSTAEAKALTEMPPLPTQPGLICQGWNYDLETIKSYDTPVTVGATYITDDGKTRIYITLPEGRTSPVLGVGVNGTVTVDWGDGTEPDVLTGTSTSNLVWTPNHNYASPGDYVISLMVEGSMGILNSAYSATALLLTKEKGYANSQAYHNSIKKIEFGSGVVAIGQNALRKCNSLSSVTIPNNVASFGIEMFRDDNSLSGLVIPYGATSIRESSFYECSSLKIVSIPHSVTSISASTFQSCVNLANVAIPNNIASIGKSAFNGCRSLSRLVIPGSVTSIGNDAFSSCSALSSLVIPSSVTTIGSTAFANCLAIKHLVFHASVTSIASGTFSQLNSLVSLVIPHGVVSIEARAIYSCRALSNLVIPDSVTSIGNDAFSSCSALSSLVIPSSVTTIGGQAFYSCESIKFFDFTSHASVPTLSGSSAFSGIPSDCEIRVPAALYDTWIAATNWSTYASKIVAV